MPGALVEAGSIGEAWVGIAARILADGAEASYDGRPVLELRRVTIAVAHPSPRDELIERHADPERLAWMAVNFNSPELVEELGGARSYASRLRDYARSGLDQVDWVAERLRRDPTSRSATITTFEPLLDTSYIPCVSLLDFWRPDAALELVVTAHSIDFGTKGYGNLVQLAAIQTEVALALSAPVGRLDVQIKSAHISHPELERMRQVVAAAAG